MIGRRRRRKWPTLDRLVRDASMLGIWIDERLPQDRMPSCRRTRSVEEAASFVARHETEIATAPAVARAWFPDDAGLDDVFEILRPRVVVFVEEHLRCTLLDRPRPPH